MIENGRAYVVRNHHFSFTLPYETRVSFGAGQQSHEPGRSKRMMKRLCFSDQETVTVYIPCSGQLTRCGSHQVDFRRDSGERDAGSATVSRDSKASQPRQLDIDVRNNDGVTKTRTGVIRLLDVNEMRPSVDEAAMDGLKFSECLPRELVLEMLETHIFRQVVSVCRSRSISNSWF